MLKTQTPTQLRNSPIFSTFAVKDTDAAKRFYKDTLGLDVRKGSEPGILELHSGDRPPVVVYPKPDHKPAVFTVLNFPVDDVDRTVDELVEAGVKMEQYDTNKIKTDAKGIARGNGPAIAWFRDPDGNILSVMSRS
jgi:catechol 2,3-dioxygenase-like lactoylglutathione lyase family enzyme